MTATDKVSTALSEWGFKVVSSFLPKYRIPAGSRLGGIMQGLLGIDPTTYNIWNELGFLAEPMIRTFVTPTVSNMLSGMTDEQVKDLVMNFADSFIEQARTKGEVNVFGIRLKEDAFIGLKQILTQKLGEE